MSSSQSPDQHGEAGPPTSFNLNILRNISDKRTRDGEAPKRRGPKPDSRPALTRRQELNRQAQRTHRERKELYIKALEDEVLRLKEVFSSISQDKERLAEENRQLKSLLAQSVGGGGSSTGSHHGGGGGGGGGSGRDTSTTPGSHLPGPGSSAGASAYTTPTSFSTLGQGGGLSSPPQQYGHAAAALGDDSKAATSSGLQKRVGLDYDQAGIDFVLTLEKPCMVHLPLLLEAGGGERPTGHALMASCPPQPFRQLDEAVPFGTAHVTTCPTALAAPAAPAAPAGQDAVRTWEPAKADLAKLLALSAQLGLDGEITPVMAWCMILAHPRLGELTEADLKRLTDELGCKSRCYGFGAVMEEFELRDALANVFSTKSGPAAQSTMAMAY